MPHEDDTLEHLRKAYRRLLYPLVKILIRNGITAVETGELLRQVFVDAAMSEEFQVSGRRISDTRVAILTGLSRKEVHRLRRGGMNVRSKTNLNRVIRVISGWNQDPDFTGPYGVPLALPFEDDPDSDASSFTELVRRYSGDMAPRAMLDELLRTGLAEMDGDDRITNTGRAYIPTKLNPAAIEELGRVVSRLADTLDFNNQVESSKLGRFERQVVTDIGLTEEQYRQFNVYLRAKCQEFLETVDNWLAVQEGRVDVRERREELEPREKLITGIGVFHFLDQRLPFERDEEEQDQGD